MRGAAALAIFACAPAGILEVVRLPKPVEPSVVIDSAPWLEPLAAVQTVEGWGVALVSRRAARLFRGGPRGLVQFAAVEDDVHGRHAQGGWSQARYQRGIEQEVAWHLRRTAELLFRAHRRRPFQHLALVAAAELAPKVEASFHADLRALAGGIVDADLEHAPTEEVLRAVTPLMDEVDREREGTLLDRLEQALATGGRAAAGVDEVVSKLREQRVEALLIADGSQLVADAAAHGAIELALRQAAEVVVVRHAPGRLHAHGSIAALLRW